MTTDIKNILLKIIKDYPFNYAQHCCSKKNIELKTKINELTKFLNESSFQFKYSTKIFCILNDINQIPKCKVCGKQIEYDIYKLDTGFNKHKIWAKGDEFQLTCHNHNCIKVVQQEKIKATCLQRYGVDNVYKSLAIKLKIKQTCLKKYGIASPGNSVEGREKAKKTWLLKYGVDHPQKCEKIKNKTIQTNLKKYGKSSYTKTTVYHERCVKNNLTRFLTKHQNDAELIFTNLQQLYKLQSIGEFFKTKFDVKCKRCNLEFQQIPNVNNYYKYGTFSSCKVCHPKQRTTSNGEHDIFEFLQSLKISNIIENTRTIIPPMELDIYIPDKQIAIEYDGLYWHSDDSGLNNTYHCFKSEVCEKIGVQLIHVFENEWLLKTDIVKNRIKNILGIYDRTLFARKCIVKQIDSKISKAFQDQNHIQGSVNASINLGLFYDNELVSLMTFGKTRFSKKYEWEMLRFCNKCGYHVPGAASKLLKHFEKEYQPKSLVSYADRRWSQGKLYKALGFTLDHISPPNYWYWKTDNIELQSRIKFQKHKQKNILKDFDKNKSEVENMKNNGYHRIFDCGNYVFFKQYNI